LILAAQILIVQRHVSNPDMALPNETQCRSIKKLESRCPGSPAQFGRTREMGLNGKRVRLTVKRTREATKGGESKVGESKVGESKVGESKVGESKGDITERVGNLSIPVSCWFETVGR
jgi:hypothetical protein